MDASFGFEMETFEFLNILQVHGFPKVMGVLTHLDVLTSAKTLRKTKKRLKQRFWTEIYQVGPVHKHMQRFDSLAFNQGYTFSVPYIYTKRLCSIAGLFFCLVLV